MSPDPVRFNEIQTGSLPFIAVRQRSQLARTISVSGCCCPRTRPQPSTARRKSGAAAATSPCAYSNSARLFTLVSVSPRCTSPFQAMAPLSARTRSLIVQASDFNRFGCPASDTLSCNLRGFVIAPHSTQKPFSESPQRPLLNHDVFQELCTRNTARGVAHTCASLALYAACCWAGAQYGWFVQIIAWSVQAGLFLGATSLVHECIHGLFARAKWINRCIGVIAAAIHLKNYSLHRAFHLRHHACTTRADDPEAHKTLRNARDYVSLLIRHADIVSATYSSWLGVWRSVRGSPPNYLPKRDLVSVRLDASVQVFWVSVVLLGLAFYPGLTLRNYIVPLCFSMTLSFFVFLPEHFATTTGSEAAIENTRTIQSNAILRFLYWNNNFHAEHHAFPGVPFFRLQRLHHIIAPRIVHSASSYTQFHVQLLRRLSTGSLRPTRTQSGP